MQHRTRDVEITAAWVACPLREIRASTTTLSNCDSRREGIMAMESSKWKLTGQAAAVVRRTASGGPGESAAFA